jgi:hypothetical protein
MKTDVESMDSDELKEFVGQQIISLADRICSVDGGSRLPCEADEFEIGYSLSFSLPVGEEICEVNISVEKYETTTSKWKPGDKWLLTAELWGVESLSSSAKGYGDFISLMDELVGKPEDIIEFGFELDKRVEAFAKCRTGERVQFAKEVIPIIEAKLHDNWEDTGSTEYFIFRHPNKCQREARAKWVRSLLTQFAGSTIECEILDTHYEDATALSVAQIRKQ